MNDIQQIWKKHEESLNQQWAVSLTLIREIKVDEVNRKMRSLLIFKGFTAGFYAIVTMLLVMYSVSRWNNSYLAVSGLVIGVWTLSITIAALVEFKMILSIDYSKTILVLQNQLIKVRKSIIHYLRLGVLAFPLNLAFIVLFFDIIFDVNILEVGDKTWLISQFLFSLIIMLPLAIWMYFKLVPANANKKWMRRLLLGNGAQIYDSLELLGELEELAGQK